VHIAPVTLTAVPQVSCVTITGSAPVKGLGVEIPAPPDVVEIEVDAA